MADQDTTVTVENGEKVDTSVETPQGEDEQVKTDEQENDQADTGNEEGDSGSKEGESEDKAQTKKEAKAEFEKRFSQFSGETVEEYLKNLEEAYANSSTEGQRNKKEAQEAKERYDKVAALVANDPEFAKKLEEVDGAPKPIVDPALEYARGQMEAQYERDWGTFTKDHPEIATDSELQKELIEELDLIGYAAEKKGRKLSMAEGLKKAWISLGKQAADDKEKVVAKTKEQASKTSPAAKGKSDSGKTEYTPEQIAVAKKMGLTPEQLAKYNSK